MAAGLVGRDSAVMMMLYGNDDDDVDDTGNDDSDMVFVYYSIFAMAALFTMAARLVGRDYMVMML